MKLTAMLIAVAIVGARLGQDSFLDRPLVATRHLIYAPPGDLRSPSDASELGFLSRVARVAAVPFGFESDSASPRPASSGTVEPHEITAATVREALDAFVRFDPRYEWRTAGGMYVVRTSAAWNDPTNVLNRPVPDGDWRDLSTLSAFNRVSHLLYPDDTSPLYTGLSVKNDRPFSVQVRGGTILDLLNAIALADGELGWSVRYGRPPDQIQFELTIGHYGIGPTHGWRRRPG
jgi:hypothetical protein